MICLLLSNIFGRYCTSLSISVSLDAPEGGEKGSGVAAAIGDELDIFGPMVSNPLPSSNNTQQAQVMHSLSVFHQLLITAGRLQHTESAEKTHTANTPSALYVATHTL